MEAKRISTRTKSGTGQLLEVRNESSGQSDVVCFASLQPRRISGKVLNGLVVESAEEHDKEDGTYMQVRVKASTMKCVSKNRQQADGDSMYVWINRKHLWPQGHLHFWAARVAPAACEAPKNDPVAAAPLTSMVTADVGCFVSAAGTPAASLARGRYWPVLLPMLAVFCCVLSICTVAAAIAAHINPRPAAATPAELNVTSTVVLDEIPEKLCHHVDSHYMINPRVSCDSCLHFSDF